MRARGPPRTQADGLLLVSLATGWTVRVNEGGVRAAASVPGPGRVAGPTPTMSQTGRGRWGLTHARSSLWAVGCPEGRPVLGRHSRLFAPPGGAATPECQVELIFQSLCHFSLFKCSLLIQGHLSVSPLHILKSNRFCGSIISFLGHINHLQSN